MSFLVAEPGVLTRIHIKDPSDSTDSAPLIVTEMIDALDGNQRHYIELKMAERFAVRMEESTDDSGGTVSKIARSIEAKKAAIEYGLLEVALSYLYDRIVREWNILSRGERFLYDNADDGYIEDIETARKNGSRLLNMIRVDELASATGSAAVLIQVLGSELNYQSIGRDSIWVCFAETIIEGDKERPVNPLNIEEASLVVVSLGAHSYIAYYARSAEYPNGRQVKYTANYWYDIPDDSGEAGETDEYSDYRGPDGKVANPLTLWSNLNSGGMGIPEYPIATWLGSTKGYGLSLLPVSSSLYKQTKELDLAYSRILMSTLKSARGFFALSKTEGASNKYPETMDEGMGILENGLALSTHSTPGINQQIANDITASMAAHTSEAFRVPAYKLAINSSAVIPSGAALIELNKPQLELHQSRAEMNRVNVDRIFRIENGLASVENGKIQGKDVIEDWQPNHMDLQLPEKERIENAVAKQAAGIFDVNKVAEEVLPHINSKEEAQAYIAELEAAPVVEKTGVERFR